MGLDARGILSLLEGLAYIPILISVIVLVSRHGFKRKTSWVFLLTFSAVRVIGGGLYVAAETIMPTNSKLYLYAVVLQSAGVSPLMGATLGFVGLSIANTALETSQITTFIRVLHLLATAAVAVVVIGANMASSSSSNKDNNGSSSSATPSGNVWTHLGSFIYLIILALLAFILVDLMGKSDHLERYRRKIMKAICFTIPFILVRIVYSILSSFSTRTDALHEFSITTGAWAIYLLLGIVPEYIVALTYCIVGMGVPHSQPDSLSSNDAYPYHPNANGDRASTESVPANDEDAKANYPPNNNWIANPGAGGSSTHMLQMPDNGARGEGRMELGIGGRRGRVGPLRGLIAAGLARA